MFGYACNETPELMPLAISIAHKMAKRLTDVRKQGLVDYLRPDGKTQITVEYDENGKPVRVDTVVLSTQHSPDVTLEQIRKDMIELVIKPTVPAGLLDGETTIRTVGGVADFDTIIRDAARRGEILSPRVVASNMAVSVPGGHMAGSLAYEARTPEEAAAFVEKIAAEKPDLIKLMITGGVMDAEVVGEPGVLRMQPALVKAACDKAHALGMQVAAHVESPEGVRVALENGVDSIEHGAKPDEHIMQLCKERGAFQVSTISPAVPYALFDRSISHATYEQQENGKVVFEGIIAMAKACLADGVPVGLGTDTGCPYITHYDMWRELCYFVKYCGVTPAFALHSATLGNAALAGIAGETGSIQPGKCADMIVCAADPLADLTALRTLDMVIKSGYRVEHPQVKKMDNVERELDKFL